MSSFTCSCASLACSHCMRSQPKSGILRLDAAGPFFLHDVLHDRRQRRPGAHVALRQAVRNNLQLSVILSM